MSTRERLRVISIGLDPTIALVDPLAGSRGDSVRRQEEYADLAASYTAIVKTPRASCYQPRRWGNGHAILPTLSRTAWLFPIDAFRLAAQMHQARGTELVVTQDPFLAGLAGYWLKKRFGMPLCVQVHNDMIGCEWWLRESPVNRLMEPFGVWLIRRADTVQVVSRTIRERLTARGLDPMRAWNIMSGAGIDCQQFRAADGASLRRQLLGEMSSIVLFMGRLVKQKDLPTLLQAASLVIRERPDTLFVLVGDGEEAPTLQRLRHALQIDANVALLRGVGPNEAPAFFAACDVFAMSSLYEGKARALVEAACAAKPIVTTDVSGADEVVVDGKTGFLVPVRDPGALASRILWLLSNLEEAREMGRRGQELACERYDRRRNLQEVVRMWEATAACRTRSR